jgi:hypothetical protein
MRLFLQPADERARPRQSRVKVVNPEEQEEAIAWLGVVRARERGMVVSAPLMETQQDCSVRVANLSEMMMRGRGLRQAEQRLIPFEAPGHVSHADDRPDALHGLLPGFESVRGR